MPAPPPPARAHAGTRVARCTRVCAGCRNANSRLVPRLSRCGGVCVCSSQRRRAARLHALLVHTCVHTYASSYGHAAVLGAGAHPPSAHTDPCALSAAARVCAYRHRWVLPGLTQGCVVFLLGFLPPPSSAPCGDGRRLVRLFPSSRGRTSRRYPRTAPAWTHGCMPSARRKDLFFARRVLAG